tara:strand:- start:992 stop:1225 length:234 start_codon:yes stop_codon:yes gene_type:complete
MLEKYLKMCFSFNLKKNINLFLIILVLLILAILFFGNFNLVEGYICNNISNDNVPPVGAERLENINNNVQAINGQCP